jgi:hypothetical protein
MLDDVVIVSALRTPLTKVGFGWRPMRASTAR